MNLEFNHNIDLRPKFIYISLLQRKGCRNLSTLTYVKIRQSA
jgi:hypothetical protein